MMISVVREQDMNEIIEDGILKRAIGKSFLFVGGAGMVLSYMIKTLVTCKDHFREGFSCICAIVRGAGNGEFEDYTGRNDFILLKQDVCKEGTLPDINFDYVIYGAGLTNPAGYLEKPVETLLVSSIGIERILSRIKNQKSGKSRVIFISSASVYGKLESRNGLKEEDSGQLDFFDYKNSYSEGKRFGEALCNSYAKEYGLNMGIVRLFYVYGAGMKLNDGRLFSDLVPEVIEQRDIILKSDGRALRNFIYISNAVRAIFYVCFLGTSGETYNVASPDGTVSIAELCRLMIQTENSRSRIKYQKEGGEVKNPSNTCDMNPDISKLNRIPGVRVSDMLKLEEGIKRLFQSVERSRKMKKNPGGGR